MQKDIERTLTPEEHELEKKLAELSILEAQLGQKELERATLEAELFVFEQNYLRAIGKLIARLDSIKAETAEALTLLHPDNQNLKNASDQARSQANQSTHEVNTAQSAPIDRKQFQPSEGIKDLYRHLAKRIHPDLANDEEERKRRTRWMAELNAAFQSGDEARLHAIMNNWEHNPDSVQGEDIGAKLVKVIRKIALVQDRLQIIDEEIERMKKTDLFLLKKRVESAAKEGRDLLIEMADNLQDQISDAENNLVRIREELHVKGKA